MRLFATALLVLTLGSTAVAQPVTLGGIGTFATAPGVGGLTTGAFSFAFILPQSPTPAVSIPGETFVLAGVNGEFIQGTTTTPVTGDLFFFTSGLGGLFSLDVNFQTLLNPFDGPQLFTGPTDTPSFVLGSWTPADPIGFGVGSVTQVSVTSAATVVPEPATVALVGLGLAVLSGVARARRRTPAPPDGR